MGRKRTRRWRYRTWTVKSSRARDFGSISPRWAATQSRRRLRAFASTAGGKTRGPLPRAVAAAAAVGAEGVTMVVVGAADATTRGAGPTPAAGAAGVKGAAEAALRGA